MHAVEQPGAPARALLPHAAVGEEHELLHQLVALEVRASLDPPGHAALVHPGLDLGHVQLERAGGEPAAAQGAGHAHQALHVPLQLGRERPRPVQRGLHLAVVQAVAAAHHRLGEAPAEDVALAVHLRQHRQGEPVAVRAQRAQVRRQRLGQHRHRPARQVARGPPGEGLGVEGAARPDVVRDVGDVHADLEPPGRRRPQRQGVVVVARVLGVHAEDEGLAQVEAPMPLGGARLAAGGRLGQDAIREARAQPELRGDPRVVPLGAVVRPQHLDEVGRPLVRDLRHAPVAVLRPVRTAPGELAAPAPPAPGGIEQPSAARRERAADQAPDGRLRRASGSASCGDSCGAASCACGWRSSCACASCLTPFLILHTHARWPRPSQCVSSVQPPGPPRSRVPHPARRP